MMPVGVFAKTYKRANVQQVFAAVRAGGFEVAHFNFAGAGLEALPFAIPDKVVEEIVLASAAASLDLVGVSATFNMAHPDPAVRADGLRRLETIAAVCNRINTPVITLCTGSRDWHDQWKFHPDNNSKAAWRDMSDTIEKAIAIAEKYDVQLGIEPELNNVVSSVGKAAQLLREQGNDRLRIVLDPANLFETAGVDRIKGLITQAIDNLGPAVVMAHAKDRSASGAFAPPGQGIIPFDFFIKQLKMAGISRPIIAHGFAESEAAGVARYLTDVQRH